MIKGLLFWGYLDNTGRITVKRYVNDTIIANYERMTDIVGIFDPFEAFDMTHAKELVNERYAMEK
jgi:hypothetical protein